MEAGWLEGRYQAEGARSELLKNPLLGGAAVSGIASGILGARIAKQSSEGDTPFESGTQPAPETPQEAASSQRLIPLTGTSNLALLAGAIAVSAVIENSAVKPRSLLSRLVT